MNHEQFVKIRRLFFDLAAPRRHWLKADDLEELRLAVRRQWYAWRQSMREMKKTEKLLRRIVRSYKLDTKTYRLAIGQIDRLTAITDEAYEA
jgi:hypothetical protein